MNRAYKIVFKRNLGTWQVVSELAKSCCKSAMRASSGRRATASSSAEFAQRFRAALSPLPLLAGLVTLALAHPAHADIIADSGGGGIYANDVEVVSTNQPSPWNLGSLVVGQNANTGATDTLTINQGSILSSTRGQIGSLAGSNGRVVVTGPGSRWNANTELVVGGGGNATLDIANGGVVSSQVNTYLGSGFDSVGIVNVDGTGSAFTNTFLAVGSYGDGTLNINSGATATAYNSIIGHYNTGAVNIDGPGSSFTSTMNMTVGSYGSGTLDVTNGALVSDRTATVANSSASSGSVTVEGPGSTWKNSTTLTVGGSGSGTLDISNGGAVSVGQNTTLASSNNSVGTVTVDGTGSTFTNGVQLSIGGYGNGTLSMSNGGAATTYNSIIGHYNRGSVEVDGAGSSFTSSGHMTVGSYGTGTLHITDGGLVSDNSSTVGNSSGSSGSVTVDGAGSTWNTTTNLVVGGSGKGTLDISNGGTVTDAAGYVGNGSNAVGRVSVDGVGSTWTNALDLVIGNAGSGTLNITNGGTVSDATATIGNATGNGVATVSGAGSTWSSSGFLVVSGGSLAITDGGVASSAVYTTGVPPLLPGSGYVGAFGQTGSALIDGTGSAWNNSGALSVGGSELDADSNHSHGILTLANDGQVSADSVTVATIEGSSGVINIGAAQGSAATGAGILASPSVTLGSGGSLVFNHTESDYLFAPTISGSGLDGQAVNVLAGTTILSGSNTYTGGTTITSGTLAVDPASIASTSSLGSGTVFIDGQGTLRAATQGDFSFANALTGTGTLLASNDGGAFSFGAGAGNAFSGTVALSDNTFLLGGEAGTTGAINETTLTHATLRVDDGSDVTVAEGNHQIGGLTFNGGTVHFGAVAPAQTVADSTLALTGLNAAGTGTVSIDIPDNYAPALPTPPDQSSLFSQSHGSALLQLATADNVVGNASGLTLQDQNGMPVSDAREVELTQNGATVAVGSYGYGLSTGEGNDGLYVNYGLSQIDILAGQTLTLAEDPGASGSDADMAAKLTGTGNLLINAGDSVSLSNTTNDFTGTTEVASGTLQAGAANVIASSSAVTLGAGTRFDTHGFNQSLNNLNGAANSQILLSGNNALTLNGGSDPNVFAGAVSGAGALVQASGTQVLTGVNTYTGGTLISSGTLQLGDGGTSGSILGSVANNGTLAFNRSDDVDFTGTIVGSGTVEQLGDGTTTLAGPNGYTGGTVISDGTLKGSATSFGSGDILDNAALVLDQSADATFANAINGTGTLTKSGEGLLNLTGTSSLSGATSVVAGTLAVNGSLGNSNVTVGDGATLGGEGTVGGIVARAGSTVAPGNNGSIGTLSVSGDVTFDAGSTYQAALNPSTGPLIDATGKATLNGGTVAVLAGAGNYAPSYTYTILTAAQGRTGQFDGVTTNLAFLTPSLTDDANNVYLTMVRNQTGFGDIGGTPNQKAAGEGTESLGDGNPIYDAVVQLDESSARAAFDQLSGEIHASAQSAFLEDSRFIREAALDRLRSSTCGVSGASTVLASSDARSADTDCDGEQSVVWTRAFGSWGNIDSDGNAAHLDRSVGGLLLGVDGIMANRWRVGAFGGYSQTDLDVNDRNSSATSDNYHLGLYAGTQWDRLSLRTGAAYSWHDLSTRRSPSFNGYHDRLTGDYHAQTAQVFGELGYAVDAGEVALEPFANLALVNVHTEGFTEHGGAAALTAKSQNSDATFSTLGLRGSTQFQVGKTTAKVSGSLGWRHAFGDVTPDSTFAYDSGSTPFHIAGVPIARNAAVVDTGLDFTVGKNTSIGVSYNGQYGDGVTDSGVRANFKLKF
ncbi:autotransporter domain-containing protein [Pseudomonas sp. DP-17]|uniref:autotransporter domain-containing protein n=1 Tax=Pseudomonas sp. DP-17 TaxID=1580486 RepID=UPI001EFAB395|nr:autotransporter domain-containing protein [Pseudomonas sp. DP-17]MCG8909304.1 autotransporter domain-containing protein [Pseudomonas sp. DP-17]